MNVINDIIDIVRATARLHGGSTSAIIDLNMLTASLSMQYGAFASELLENLEEMFPSY